MTSSTLVLLSVSVMASVSFFTLFERKVLGGSQLRQGPVVVSYGGLLQPISDAAKLFVKEWGWVSMKSVFVYLFSPGLLLVITLCMLATSGLSSGSWESGCNYLLLFALMSCSVYPLIGIGWSAGSPWALIGASRCFAQVISYEVCFSLCFLFWGSTGGTFTFKDLEEMGVLGVSVGLICIWLICCLSETNRSPYDFGEGESELVSGFNIELGGGVFAILFISEYLAIIFLSVISILIWGGSYSSCGGVAGVCALMYAFVWVRASLPRFRYDKLMSLCWMGVLPGTLLYSVMSVLV